MLFFLIVLVVFFGKLEANLWQKFLGKNWEEKNAKIIRYREIEIFILLLSFV